MRVFYNLSDIRGKIPHAAVTVGSFDGVHAGHREIIRTLNRFACEKGGESVIVTFNPHPRHVLCPDDDSLKLLNSIDEKIHLLEQTGVDNLLIIPFTHEFSRLGSETFARQYLLEGIGAESIIMGYNHHFGHDRQGKDFLETLQSEYDFEIFQLPKQLVTDHKVSSTVVRELVRKGELSAAREMLTCPYFLMAEYQPDGFLSYTEPRKLLPPDGSYPVEVHNGASSFRATLDICPEGLKGSGFLLPDHPETLPVTLYFTA